MGAHRCRESVRRIVDEETGETLWEGYRLDEALLARRKLQLQEQRLDLKIKTLGLLTMGGQDAP